MSLRWLQFEHLHQPDGWRSPGFLAIDGAGLVAEVRGQRPGSGIPEFAGRFGVPGLPNVHGHAFQRAVAGFGERAAFKHRQDSFWTWRTQMYDTALRMTPEQLAAVAAQLYVEMLQVGITSAAEFHYLHGDLDGRAYVPPERMGVALFEAAAQTGLRLTLLPVFYAHAGIGQPLSPEQRRFGLSGVDAFLKLLEALSDHCERGAGRTGLAPHSLRAVSAEELTALLEGARGLDPALPIHLHIAEQFREVQEVVAAYGARPVQWLLDHYPVDTRWCLVHATHCEERELKQLASSGAVVGLCPQTEANLGDGVFGLEHFLQAGGRIGVGTDSHIRVSVAAELSLLEYGQRLWTQRRNVTALPERALWASTGRRLYDEALRGGAQALAQPVGALTPGASADLVVLDGEHPRLLGHGIDTVFDAWIFSAGDAVVRDVMVQGRWVVRGGRHRLADQVGRQFARAMQQLAV